MMYFFLLPDVVARGCFFVGCRSEHSMSMNLSQSSDRQLGL